MNEKNTQKKDGFNSSFWALGMSLGLIFGMLLGSTGIGLCFGSGLGLLLCVITGSFKKTDDGQNEPLSATKYERNK